MNTIKGLTTIEQDLNLITRPTPTRQDMERQTMPSKQLSKSLDDFNSKIAEYEMLSSVIIDKLRRLLRLGFSETLLMDYEFAISSLTLLRLNIIPRNANKLIRIHKKYQVIKSEPFIFQPIHLKHATVNNS